MKIDLNVLLKVINKKTLKEKKLIFYLQLVSH
jgi:hypothetical protein